MLLEAVAFVPGPPRANTTLLLQVGQICKLKTPATMNHLQSSDVSHRTVGHPSVHDTCGPHTPQQASTKVRFWLVTGTRSHPWKLGHGWYAAKFRPIFAASSLLFGRKRVADIIDLLTTNFVFLDLGCRTRPCRQFGPKVFGA